MSDVSATVHKSPGLSDGYELLLRAHPHAWGPGAIHLVNEGTGRTWCGKELSTIPGDIFRAFNQEITCRSCKKSVVTWAERERQSAQWKREAEERAQQKAEEQRQWWEAYDRYLESPVWQEKRRLVLRRANGVCEGCQKADAVQVHHEFYPRECLPGSPKWIAQEKLFHLIAICRRCHEDLHSENMSIEDTKGDGLQSLWIKVVGEVRRRRPLIQLWVEVAKPLSQNGSELLIGFPSTQQLAMESLLRSNNRKFIEEVLSEIAGTPLTVRAELRDDLSPN